MGWTVPHERVEQKSAVTALTSVTLITVLRLAVLAALTACSFEHGIPEAGAALDASPGVDAPMVVDAQGSVAADAAIDAPPPCADDDQDGECNEDDDWPCGEEPSEPSATMVMTGNNGKTRHTITEVELDDSGRLAVASPQENLSLELHYEITDTACPSNCVDQLEIGWSPGNRAGCVFDAPVSKQNGAKGDVSVTIRAPSTPGVYDLRANIGQNYSCNYNGANNWWGGAPGPTRTIAKLCVH